MIPRCLTALLLLLALLPRPAVPADDTTGQLLDKAVARAAAVKAFGKIIGIEPSDTLSTSTRAVPGASRLWIWLQQKGTLAVRRPMDLVLQLGFRAEQARVPLDSVGHWHEMGGYSYYWRHSNEFESAEDAAAITVAFANEPVRRQVEVVLHEDLHANDPFKRWPFRINEGIVTPLADLAALAFFRAQGDRTQIETTEAHIEEQRKLSRELNGLAETIQQFFSTKPLEPARRRALRAVEQAPTYSRFFEHHVEDQSPDVLLEAKVSHDWAYYALYESVVTLYEQHGRKIDKLIEIFKAAPSGVAQLEAFLREIGQR